MADCATAISKKRSGGTKVKTHRGEPRWHVPDLSKLEVPGNLQALHAEVAARWGIIDLLDFLKQSDFITKFTDAFSTVATRENTPREVIRKRLLLVLYALGTNIGIKRVSDGGTQGETEAALRARPGICSSTATTYARLELPRFRRHFGACGYAAA
jgi:hypothetical protein